MRTFEILIPLLLVIYFICSQNKYILRFTAALPTMVLILTLVHVKVEGARWQMIPLYSITIIIFLTSLPLLFNLGSKISGEHVFSTALKTSLSLFMLTIATIIPVLLPVPTLPKTNGPYQVGTKTILLTDNSRKEIYSGKDEPRKFLVEIWYPATTPQKNNRPAPWMPDAKIVAPAIADYIHLPHFFLDHLTLAKSSSYENIASNYLDGPYPVLIFSHGWNGFRQQSTFLLEELASQGYIVAALEHTYGARLTVFPDGTIAPNNPNALPSGKSNDEYESAARILVNQWAGDIGYTIDFLQNLNENDPSGQFKNLLQMNNLGILGHSTGGGATIQFCSTDSRCKAGLTLDAFMRPVGLDVIDSGTQQPFLYIFSELWPFPRNSELFNRYSRNVNQSSHMVTILGADHYDFTDLPALSPLAPAMGLKGPINGTRVQNIIDAYALAFFGQQLKGIHSTLLDGPQVKYPDVRYDR